MAGKTLKELGFTEEVIPKHHSVKEAVFPFSKFTGVDIILGPEMKSTGEVMGIDYDLGMAFAKSQMAAGGIPAEDVFKVGEGRPNIVDHIINGQVQWIINTPLGAESKFDERAIRRSAIENNVPIMTTLAAARAGVQAIRALREGAPAVKSIQEYHADLK
jgi:carbamoyl-phosphate synthase large subunit